MVFSEKVPAPSRIFVFISSFFFGGFEQIVRNYLAQQ